jgi:stage V sporulation protein AE
LKEGVNMDYLKAFLIGGIICVIGQILIDKTKITPARMLVLFVTTGVILGALGIYEPLVKYGGAGATVPLPGFGYALAKGVFKEVDKIGFIGAFTGGIKGTAAGISAAIFFGYLAAVIFNPKAKS